MKPPIVVNESSAIDSTGDVFVFNTVSDLERYLEPWYVDEAHFIFDSEGLQLVITPTKSNVKLAPKEPGTADPGTARFYFGAHLRSIARAKGWSFVGVTENFVDTATLAELATINRKFATR